MSNQDSTSVMRAIEILADLVAFDTISSNSNLALMRYVEALLGKRGIVADLLPDASGAKANLFVAMGPKRPNGVILSGHSDVVPVLGQNWTSDPFVLTRRDGRLYGRGAADMKAFLACSLATVEFADLEALEQPIYLAFSYDEEIGCLGAPSLIEHIRSRVELPAVVVVGEPTTMRIVASHKSVDIYKVSISGVPAHSSATHLGLSANTVAIRLMNKLMQTADRLTMSDMQNGDYQPPFSTLTVGLMQGGTAANILAAEASFVFDLRCLPEHEPEEILGPFFTELELVRSIFPSAHVVVESLATVPSLAHVTGGEAELMVRSIGGDNRPLGTVSFGAEAGQFQRAGFSTLMCGPGSMDQGHQPDEYIEVAEIEKCMRFMARLFGQDWKKQTG